MCEIEGHIEREAQMQLLGATGIEDLLQEGVASALKRLLEARISVWMLTGDNVSTAVNIATSCNLFEADFEEEGRLFKLDREHATELDQLEHVIREAQHVIDSTSSLCPETNYGLALHSDVWKLLTAGIMHASSTPNLAHHEQGLSIFFALAGQCRSVMACRL